MLYGFWLIASQADIPKKIQVEIDSFTFIAIPLILVTVNIVIFIMWKTLGQTPFLIFSKIHNTIELPKYNKKFNLSEVKCITPVTGQSSKSYSSSPWTTGPTNGGPSLKTELQLVTKENERQRSWHIISSGRAFDTFKYITAKLNPIIIKDKKNHKKKQKQR